MEIPRMKRSEYPRPSSTDREIQYFNATRFIDNYLQRIQSPLPLLNHVGIIPFESRPEDIEEREAGLAEYLFLPPPEPSQWIWGRTIVAEVVAQQLIHAVLAHALEDSSMYVDLVPTSIDASSRKDQLPYQKGIDVCILQTQEYEGSPVAAPICGVDVTVGGKGLVKSKRKKPGVQTLTATPAIVIPLNGLTYDGKKARSFHEYMDEHARRQILKNGTYTPFYGLEEPDITIWKESLRIELFRSLDACEQGLRMYADHPGLENFPYMGEVRSKLQATRELLRGRPLPLAS